MKLKNGKICGCTECNQDHCSELCRQNWYVEKRRRKNLEKRALAVLTAEIKTCHCGRLFIPKTWNQKTCSPVCSANAHRARYRKAA